MTKKNFTDFSKPNLPTEESGRFTGERGNSDFIPNSQKAREAMRSFGADSVKYVNGYPDFSPFTVVHDDVLGTVDGRVEIGHMTPDRPNPKYAFGRRTDGHAADEDLGNFAQADNELAKALNERNGTALTGKDIQEMRKRNKLTWHEVEDGKTMHLVPTRIHAACPHSGGVSIEKDLHRIADSEDYDFDTGEYNAMDYTYDEENDLLIPIAHGQASAESYIPRKDEYAFTGKVDANPQYGSGGATQYYVPYANEMKQDGRLVPVGQQVEDVTARTGSGKTNQVKEYTDKNGVHTTLDYRPMDPDEWKDLEESSPKTAEEAAGRAYDLDEVSEEELAASAKDMPSDAFYKNYDEEYKHPLTNQENSGGTYSPDGWKEPVNLQPGQRLYQVSTDGDTKSCYFTDQETIDSCSREDGSVDFEALRGKLQIGNGDDKITLTAYEFQPEPELENASDAPTKKQAETADATKNEDDVLAQNGNEEDQTKAENVQKTEDDVLAQNGDEEDQAKAENAQKTEDDVLSQNGDEEDQTKAENAEKSEDDVLAQNGDEEDQAKAENAQKTEDDVLAQNGDEENQTKAENAKKSEDDVLAQNGDEEDQAKAEDVKKSEDDVLAQNSSEDRSEHANAAKSEDETIDQKEDKNKKSSGQEDEDVLAQNSGEQDEQERAAVQPTQPQETTEQASAAPQSDAKESGNSRDDGMGMA